MNLDRRLPLTDAVLLATILDPTTKDLVNLDKHSKAEFLFDAVTLMKHRVDTPVDDAIRAEIDSYLQVKSTDVDDDDPLAFWKGTKDYDNLKQLAAVILTRSASSVQVECMFSTMGLILNGKRSRLNAQSADALSFIHDNFFLIE